MRPETKLKKLLSMPDSELKVLKLYSFCFSVMPNSPIQLKAKQEIKKIQSEVIVND